MFHWKENQDKKLKLGSFWAAKYGRDTQKISNCEETLSGTRAQSLEETTTTTASHVEIVQFHAIRGSFSAWPRTQQLGSAERA